MISLLSLLTGCAPHLFGERVFDCDGVTHLEIRAQRSLEITTDDASIPVLPPAWPDEPIEDDRLTLPFGTGSGPCELLTDPTVRPARDGSRLTLSSVGSLTLRGSLVELEQVRVQFDGELSIDTPVLSGRLDVEDCSVDCFVEVTREGVWADLTEPDGEIASRLPLHVSLRDGDSTWCGDRGGSLTLEADAKASLRAGGPRRWTLHGEGEVSARLFPGTSAPDNEGDDVRLRVEDERMSATCFGDPIVVDPCADLDDCDVDPCSPICQECSSGVVCPEPEPEVVDVLITRYRERLDVNVSGERPAYQFGVFATGVADADASEASCLTAFESGALGLPSREDGECVDLSPGQSEQVELYPTLWSASLTFLVRAEGGSPCWVFGQAAQEVEAVTGCAQTAFRVTEIEDPPPPSPPRVEVDFASTQPWGVITLVIEGGAEDYAFGFVQTAVDAQGGDGWSGEDCWYGEGAFGYCHPVAPTGAALSCVTEPNLVIPGSTTLMPWDTPPLTYILIGASSGDCWVWGHDPSYYASFPGGPCESPDLL